MMFWFVEFFVEVGTIEHRLVTTKERMLLVSAERNASIIVVS